MRLNSIAHRYAQALYYSASESNISDKIKLDLALIEDVYQSNENFVKILNSPIVEKKEKKKIFSDLFKDKIDELTLNFLFILVDKNREAVLSVIKEEYEKLYNEANSISTLIIESVIKLSDEQINLIKEKMEKKLNKSLSTKNVINKDLIGGVRLLYNDNVIDGSVKTKLANINDVLSN